MRFVGFDIFDRRSLSLFVPCQDPDNEEVPSGPPGEGWVSGVLDEDIMAGVDFDEDGLEGGDDDDENDEGTYMIHL